MWNLGKYEGVQNGARDCMGARSAIAQGNVDACFVDCVKAKGCEGWSS